MFLIWTNLQQIYYLPMMLYHLSAVILIICLIQFVNITHMMF